MYSLSLLVLSASGRGGKLTVWLVVSFVESGIVKQVSYRSLAIVVSWWCRVRIRW